MRVVNHSIDEYLENLKIARDIYQQTIYVSIIRRPYSAAGIPQDPRETTRWEVIFQSTAIVDGDDGESQYVLDVGINCGFDRIDDSDEEKKENGTSVSQRHKAAISEYAASRGWRILPGVISE